MKTTIKKLTALASGLIITVAILSNIEITAKDYDILNSVKNDNYYTSLNLGPEIEEAMEDGMIDNIEFMSIQMKIVTLIRKNDNEKYKGSKEKLIKS